MTKISKRVLVGLWVGISLLLALCLVFILFIYLSLSGVIPQFPDTSPSSDYLGYQPSSGKVWQYVGGFSDGFEYTRLHLKPNEYGRLELVKLLTSSNMPEIAEFAPWWWGASPDGKTTILIGSGKGVDSKYYEIYDPSRELLFTYHESN